MLTLIKSRIQESIDVKNQLLDNVDILQLISQVSDEIISVYKSNGKIILCGNGGSASDSLHIAGELVGRFQKERRAFPAVVLNADVATMTAIANDYGYEEMFARQVEGHMTEKDLLIGFSTSGNSRNIFKAFEKATEIGGKTVGMLGNDGGTIKSIVDYSIVVPSDNTARIQESHITIGHIICEIVEKALLDN